MSGKVALITGSGRRLGRALAQGLAADGFELALHAHTSVAGAHALAAEVQAGGGTAQVFPADLSSAAQARSLVEVVLAWAGRLHLLVNNAGLIGTAGLADEAAAELDAAYAVNVRAPYLLSLRAAPSLRAVGGAIVNVASVGGERPYAKHPAYSISKAALLMQTRVLARALAPDVRVNAVLPGTLWLEGEENDAAGKPAVHRIPLGRYGNAHDVVAAVRYLARATWVTGATLRVDGGAGV